MVISFSALFLLAEVFGFHIFMNPNVFMERHQAIVCLFGGTPVLDGLLGCHSY